jgi:diguanylate cyclase (GGDEF)-like protein
MSFDEIWFYWRILKKRLWLIALLTISTVGTIIFLQYGAEPVYRASLEFQITSPPPGDVTLYEGSRLRSAADDISSIREGFLNVLTSGTVIRQAIAELDLRGMRAQDVASNITSEEIPGSDLNQVKVSANDPQLAADLANGLVEKGLEYYGELRARGLTITREFIEKELAVLRQELQDAEEELITLKIEHRIGSLDQMIQQQQELLRNLRLNRDQALAKGLASEAQKYDELIIQREEELQDLVRQSATYNALEAEVQQKRDTYDFLLQKQAEAKLTENEALGVGFIQVLSPAQPPSRPVAPLKLQIVVLGGVVSLALGVVIALVWESITSQEPAAKAVQLNIIDPETGLYNKYFFMQRLGEEMARARRQHYPLSIALLDIENLEALQAAQSPKAREELLRKTAVQLKQYVREEDVIAHFDNSTFAILLPDMSEDAAKGTVSRLQTRLAWTPLELERSGVKVHLSSIAGVAIMDNNIARDQFIARASEALQRAGIDGYDRKYTVAENGHDADEQPLDE